MPDPPFHRLNQDQRDEMTRRVLAGESATELGREFGVSRAYVALLKAQALDPERFRRKAEAKLAIKLTAAELKRFDEALSTSTPEDHDLIPHAARWTLDHGHQLAWKLFHKRPSVRVIKQCVAPYIPQREDFRFTKPQPPKPHLVNQLLPELAADPDFVTYYLSPLCEQIEWREYEAALADWNARFADDEEPVPDAEASPIQATKTDTHPVASSAPGRRSGKHAHSKGCPFTPPKRRKKRR
jgi:hypothetical protein